MVSHDGQCRVGSVMSVMMMLAGMVEVSIKIADFHAEGCAVFLYA